jgi:hypothetical protein
MIAKSSNDGELNVVLLVYGFKRHPPPEGYLGGSTEDQRRVYPTIGTRKDREVPPARERAKHLDRAKVPLERS